MKWPNRGVKLTLLPIARGEVQQAPIQAADVMIQVYDSFGYIARNPFIGHLRIRCARTASYRCISYWWGSIGGSHCVPDFSIFSRKLARSLAINGVAFGLRLTALGSTLPGRFPTVF